MPRIFLRFFGLLILLLSFSIAAFGQEVKDAETREMEQHLAGIEARANASPLSFFQMNKERAAHWKKEAVKESGSKRLQFWAEYIIETLNAGSSQEAIDEMEQFLDRFYPDRELAKGGVDAQISSLLANAYFRLAEQENCILNHSADACILPIIDGGIHSLPEGSEKAIEIYEQILAKDPEQLESRWLLNMAYMTLDGYPDDVPKEYLIPNLLPREDPLLPRFPNLAPALSVDSNKLSGGTAIDDFNGDGLLDIVAGSFGLEDPVEIFLATGDGRYRDHTPNSGLSKIVGGLNIIHADYDNDGDNDLYVMRGAWHGDEGKQANSLLRNDGNANFTDVTKSAGLFTLHPTQTAAWSDFDNDGHLDLFVGNESNGQWADILSKNRSGDGNVHLSELFKNNGDGSFTDVSKAYGITVDEFVKAVVWSDINNDGWEDLFISVVGKKNLLYVNQAGQGFIEQAEESGLADPVFGFPSWFFDFNNDGWQDLFVADYDMRHFEGVAESVARDYLSLPSRNETSRLFVNNGDGTFRDFSEAAKINLPLFAMGANFGDLNNDGYLDIYVGTGSPNLRALIPNRAFLNIGGEYYEDVTFDTGLGHLQKGHGIAFADLDADGDQDIYTVMGGAYDGDIFPNALFVNPIDSSQAWMTLELEGVSGNRSAVGARIAVHTSQADGSKQSFYRRVGTGASFGSSSLQQEIGLGGAIGIDSVVISWPNGQMSSSSLVGLDTRGKYKVVEGSEAELVSTSTVAFDLPESHVGHRGDNDGSRNIYIWLAALLIAGIVVLAYLRRGGNNV